LDTLLIEIAKQVPALVVLALLTRWFLTYMRDRDAQLLQHEEKRDAQMTNTLSHIGDDCHVVQRDSIEVMKEVKQELGATREATRELLQYVRGLNGNH